MCHCRIGDFCCYVWGSGILYLNPVILSSYIVHITHQHQASEAPDQLDVCVCSATSDLDLFLCPLVQVDRLNLGDVDPKVTMNTSTSDTDKDAQIPGCPSWT